MTRVCTVCFHPKRASIEALALEGASYRNIASQYDVGYNSVKRHLDSHIAQEIKQVEVAKQEAQAIDVVAQLKAINAVAVKIMNNAAADPDKHELALKAIDRVHKQIELQAKLQGDLDDRLKVDIAVQPEWLQLQKAMLQALRPYPEARVVVSEVIAQLE